MSIVISAGARLDLQKVNPSVLSALGARDRRISREDKPSEERAPECAQRIDTLRGGYAMMDRSN